MDGAMNWLIWRSVTFSDKSRAFEISLRAAILTKVPPRYECAPCNSPVSSSGSEISLPSPANAGSLPFCAYTSCLLWACVPCDHFICGMEVLADRSTRIQRHRPDMVQDDDHSFRGRSCHRDNPKFRVWVALAGAHGQ